MSDDKIISVDKLKKAIENETIKYPVKQWIERIIDSLAQSVESENAALKAQHETDDRIFINHIQDHLSVGQIVVCKICGKSADKIIAYAREKEKGL
jgi:exoribonuclease R